MISFDNNLINLGMTLASSARDLPSSYNVTSPSNVTICKGSLACAKANAWAVFKINLISLKLGHTNLLTLIDLRSSSM